MTLLKKYKNYLPLFSIIMFILMAVAAVINIFLLISKSFADGFNNTVAAFFRMIFSKITGVFPFSVAELIIVSIPVIIFLLIFFAIKAFKQGKIAKIRYFLIVAAIISYFYTSFVFLFAPAYRGVSISEKLDLEIEKVSPQQLYSCTLIIINELNKLSGSVKYGQDGLSDIPYSYAELNEKINAAYQKAYQKYSFLQNMDTKVKPIALSEPMTYSHISGVYTFFTGEANLNINYPDFNHPYTMAHEMAHQRGIGPENEANFIAFLVCLESDDIYVRYSAYLNMYEYFTNALYSADTELYKEIYMVTDNKVLKELIAYSDFFDKYRDNVIADVSNELNDSYLQSQGQIEGTRSYGLVVDITVAYYKSLQLI